MTTCAPVGVQFHTWQATASFGSSIGIKGMHFAAKTLALTAYDLLLNKENILDNAKKEFNERTKVKIYVPGIPEEVKAPRKDDLYNGNWLLVRLLVKLHFYPVFSLG